MEINKKNNTIWVESSERGVKFGVNWLLDIFVGTKCTETNLFLIKMDYFYVYLPCYSLNITTYTFLI